MSVGKEAKKVTYSTDLGFGLTRKRRVLKDEPILFGEQIVEVEDDNEEEETKSGTENLPD